MVDNCHGRIMKDYDETRLPKWAQARLKALRKDLEQACKMRDYYEQRTRDLFWGKESTTISISPRPQERT